MAINIESYLQKIDISLNEKTKKEIYMVYIMVFASIFAFSYLFLWDTSLKEFMKVKQQISKIQNNLNTDKIYLNANPQTRLNRLNADINKLKTELAINKDKNSYIKNKIEDISSLLYNEKTWGSYINSISENAKKYDVKILTFTNEIARTNKSFGHVLDITLNLESNYENTLKFINSLEQSKLVVDIHSLSINAQDRLRTDLNISVWGINQ